MAKIELESLDEYFGPYRPRAEGDKDDYAVNLSGVELVPVRKCGLKPREIVYLSGENEEILYEKSA